MKKYFLFMLIFFLTFSSSFAIEKSINQNNRFDIVSAIMQTKLWQNNNGMMTVNDFDIHIRFEGFRYTGKTPTHEIILKAFAKTIFHSKNVCDGYYLFSYRNNYKYRYNENKAVRKCMNNSGGLWVNSPIAKPNVDIIIEYDESRKGLRLNVFFPTDNIKGRVHKFRSDDNQRAIEKIIIKEVSYKFYNHLYDLGYSLDRYQSYIDSKSWPAKLIVD